MIASIGGVITLLISQSHVASRFYALWLFVGVSILLYVLWSPIVEAGRRNSVLRSFSTAALFDGQIAEVFTRERVENRHEQANKRGELELVENRRTWMILELEDEDGYIGEIRFPMDKKHQSIRNGSRVLCLVFSAIFNYSET